MRMDRLFRALALALLLGIPGHAAAQTVDAPIVIEWTAPGDDSLTGSAALYDVRYSRTPITEENFTEATRLLMFRPSPPGRRERVVVGQLPPGPDYYFAVRTCDERVNWSPISNVAVSAGRHGITPETQALAPNLSAPWPNPSRDRARFTLTLPRRGEVHIEAFDASGRRVRILRQGEQPAGTSELVWDLRDDRGQRLGAGVYLVRAVFGGIIRMRRIVVVH